MERSPETVNYAVHNRLVFPCKIRNYLAVLLFLFLPSSVYAQTDDIRFEQISLEQGLSQSIVECITQDSIGFMWFGTEDGINKFDGYRFTILRHDPNDPNSLSYNQILSICEDRKGILWIGTFLGGLNRYDPAKDQFKRYRADPGDPTRLSHDMIRTIYEDRSGIIWVGTDGGLNRFDKKTEVFTRYVHDPVDPEALSHNVVRAICEDRFGALWVGTEGGGLNRFDHETETFTHYLHDPNDLRTLSHNSVRSIYEDASGVLWIGTDGGGLNRFDPETETFIHFTADPDNPKSLSHNCIYTIYEDRSRTLWIGTNGGGLNKFNRATGVFTRYLNDPNDTKSLSYNEIYSIYEDRSGVLWIGTYGGGINKFDRKRKAFVHYKRDPNDSNSLSHDIVWSTYEDDDGILWIGTHGGGLNRLDRERNRYKHYRNNPDDPASLSADIVRIVYGDRSGMLWIGTHGGGVCTFDRKTEIFTPYRHDPTDPYSLSHDEIRSIYEDRSGTIWIGTNGGGLNRFDRDKRHFKRFRHDNDDPLSLSNDFVRVIYEDRRGDFWIGTQGGGLNKFDRNSSKFTHFITDPRNTNSISNNYVFSIHEDNDGLIWLGTWGGGLNRFDPRNGTFTPYTKERGLPNNSIYGILEDGEGNLWVSTNDGLSRFDKGSETFKNYNERDGLQSNEFNGGSYFKSKSGEMFFGGINGFNAFYPHKIKDNPHIPPVVVTSFKKLNKDAELDEPIYKKTELELSHKDYVFSFEFAALEYTAPEKNQYAYKMEGLDEDWIYTDSEKRFANYTTLAPGKYVFRIKASNNDGIWNEKGTAIHLTITPPFWNTWLFRTITALVFVGLIFTFYRRRVQSVRMKTELLTAHYAQMSIMPQEDPTVQGFDISGICIPANEVGGDFYDYFWMNGEKAKLGIVVGDVSGKAMQAAMIAVMSSGMIYSKADEANTPRDLVTRLNRSMYLKTDDMMFTALCFGFINPLTKEFTYTVAGINSPLLKSGNSVESLSSEGSCLPVGVLHDNTYKDKTVLLNPGDVLVLFTDGITEATNNLGEFFEHDTLEELLREIDTATLSAKEIKDQIIENVKQFTGNSNQNDDITVVIIKST